MRITIFSLGGLLGQYVTNTALLHGAQVTAYVPDAKAIWPRKNLTVIEGSLQNRERVLEALLEADAVISVLTPMRVKHVKEEETPLADGNAMILSAMKQLGKTRFVTVGHVCIHAFGDCEDKYQRMSTKFMQIFWPGVYKDMQKMYETEPADFLVQKSITRRVNNENNNVRRKILREKNAVLRENVQALKEDKKTLQSDKKKLQEEKKKLEGEKKKLQKEIDNIKQSKAYRLGNKLLWLPRKVVKRG